MAESLEPVTIRGRYLWTGDKRFLVRGVVYQDHTRPRQRDSVSDPIADDRLDAVKRDLVFFKELGLNTIFVYEVDNTKSHDAVMGSLANAGIYVLLGLGSARRCINRKNPQDSYNAAFLEECFRTIDCMAVYRNTFGALVGNEIINSNIATMAAPTIRAVTRDVKQYLSLTAEVSGARRLPVGYSAADVVSLQKATFDYLTAGNLDECLDFYCFNNYSWAGRSSIQISGYNGKLNQFSDAHIPIFFSEYGANVIPPRIFQETSAIYSPEMTHVFSGGIVYEFWYGRNEYGLAKEETDEEGRKVLVRLDDFNNLRDRLARCANIEANTDPRWADPMFTAAVERRFPELDWAWKAEPIFPVSPVHWGEVRDRLELQDWVDLRKEVDEQAVDDLAGTMEARLKLTGSEEAEAQASVGQLQGHEAQTQLSCVGEDETKREEDGSNRLAELGKEKLAVLHDTW